jgi:hypothetical protein
MTLIGMSGQATSHLVPGERGEVLLFDSDGGTASYLAYAEHDIAKGSPVIVVDELPGRTVYVAKAVGTKPERVIPGTSIMVDQRTKESS